MLTLAILIGKSNVWRFATFSNKNTQNVPLFSPFWVMPEERCYRATFLLQKQVQIGKYLGMLCVGKRTNCIIRVHCTHYSRTFPGLATCQVCNYNHSHVYCIMYITYAKENGPVFLVLLVWKWRVWESNRITLKIFYSKLNLSPSNSSSLSN